MYVEFFSLAENRGYTFRCNAVSLCGDCLRIQGPDDLDDWYFVRRTTDGNWQFKDQSWTDFGVSERPFEPFEVLHFTDAMQWLDPQ